MLLDTSNKNIEQEKTGFSPTVQNQQIFAKATTIDTIARIFITIFTLGLFQVYIITAKNWFNRQQFKINQVTSGIDVQLAQRCDTLTKLISVTKDSMKWEKDLLTQVTNLRSKVGKADNNTTDLDTQINKTYRNVLATFEQYPQLKSIDAVKKLMSSCELQEQELAASRRLYNSEVNEFNAKLTTFPSRIPASALKLHSMQLFIANFEQRQDIKINLL